MAPQEIEMPTDESLALGVQQGKRDKLAMLVERHHSPLLGYLYRMTNGNRVLAEDLVQETFLRLLRSIGQYHYPRPFKPWLYAIAGNLARDHYKRADTRRSDLVSDEMLNRIVNHESVVPLDGVLADEEAREVAAALATLPDHQRETIILRYYQELSLAEIAETLHIPVGTVKSRLSLGLRRLKTSLERGRDDQPKQSREYARRGIASGDARRVGCAETKALASSHTHS